MSTEMFTLFRFFSVSHILPCCQARQCQCGPCVSIVDTKQRCNCCVYMLQGKRSESRESAPLRTRSVDNFNAKSTRPSKFLRIGYTTFESDSNSDFEHDEQLRSHSLWSLLKGVSAIRNAVSKIEYNLLNLQSSRK